MIDLHTHSNASDGTDSPAQLIDIAIKEGITTIALCDHDTTSGIQYFLTRAGQLHVKAIPGIEISAEWNVGHCHILGLNLNVNCKDFQNMLEKLRNGREFRNIKICQKLKELGIPIDIAEVSEFAKGEVIARPHIAQVLVKKGYCKSIDDAFIRLLTKGAPAYVERFRLPPSKVVTMLKNSGASVFLAHPAQLNLDLPSLRNLASELKEYGLDGLEVYTPFASDEAITAFARLCKELKLKASGGSDYHGANKPGHRMGYYRADKPIPDSVHEAIE